MLITLNVIWTTLETGTDAEVQEHTLYVTPCTNERANV